MKIQISTDHAIRILQYLHKNGGMYTAMEIADAVGITYPFFIKIANQLKKHKFLMSVQGRNGGYALGKCAHKISLYDVFLCIEGKLQISNSIQRAERNDCELSKAWYRLQDKMIEEMSSQYITDLAS